MGRFSCRPDQILGIYEGLKIEKLECCGGERLWERSTDGHRRLKTHQQNRYNLTDNEQKLSLNCFPKQIFKLYNIFLCNRRDKDRWYRR